VYAPSDELELHANYSYNIGDRGCLTSDNLLLTIVANIPLKLESANNQNR
jgi:hypothetical protein